MTATSKLATSGQEVSIYSLDSAVIQQTITSPKGPAFNQAVVRLSGHYESIGIRGRLGVQLVFQRPNEPRSDTNTYHATFRDFVDHAQLCSICGSAATSWSKPFSVDITVTAGDHQGHRMRTFRVKTNASAQRGDPVTPNTLVVTYDYAGNTWDTSLEVE